MQAGEKKKKTKAGNGGKFQLPLNLQEMV